MSNDQPTLNSGQGASDPAPPGRSKTRALVVGGALLSLVALAIAGAWAWTALSPSGKQPHEVLPADTMAYVRIDLDPSASQKVNLFRLAQRVPDLAEEIGIDDDTDLRRLFIDEIAAGCVDYDDDVEPWLGKRLGVGVGPDNDAELPDARIALQVTDEDAAEEGLRKLFSCEGDNDSIDIAFLDGYAIITPTQHPAADAVAAAKEKSLAENENFVADTAELETEGLISGWADMDKLMELAAATQSIADLPTDELPVSGAFAVSATSTSLKVQAVSQRADDRPETAATHTLGQLPEDTLVGLTLTGVGDQVAKNWDNFAEAGDAALGALPLPGLTASPNYSELGDPFAPSTSGPRFDDIIDEIESTLGLALPDDLVTLLGDSFSVYLGSEGLAEVLSGESAPNPADVSLGLVFDGETDKVADIAERLVAAAQTNGGLELATEKGDDLVSIATSGDVAKRLTESGDLSGTDAFSDVIGDNGANALFVNVEALVELITKANPEFTDSEAFDVARIFRAVGLSSSPVGDRHDRHTLALSFTEED